MTPTLRTNMSAALLPLSLALWPLPALAHPGHVGAQSTFVSGLLHPLAGADHLAAMVMVGLWAGVGMRDRVWMAPLLFLALALAGCGTAMSGLVVPLVEPLIIASLLTLGAALIWRAQMPAGVVLALIGLFGFAHGQAHGGEMPDPASALEFAAGFLLATALLHAAGTAIARVGSIAASRLLGMMGLSLGIFLAMT